MSYSIVIPSNVAAKLRKAVKSILQAHPGLDPKRIIAVDDGAFADWKDDDPAIAWVEGVKPFIYARNVNRGIAAAPADSDIVVMGDDVRVITKGAFERLAADTIDPAVRSGQVAIGAFSAAIEGPVGNTEQNRQSAAMVREMHKPLCFVCAYFPRYALQRVGELDERFVGYGCEDVDWWLRATRQHALRFFVDDRAVVSHNDPDMPSAFRSQEGVAEAGQRAVAMLKEKWGTDK